MAKENKVMVIDDDQGMRELLYTLLTRKGYEVMLAVGGEQALQSMTREKPNLIILDYAMPGMNGLEFLRRLRSFDTDLPVIMLSAWGEEILEHEAKKLGVHDFLRKGVGVDLFIDSISKFVEPKRFARKPAPTKGYLMVVDDDAAVRDLLKQFLAKKGYEVAVADTAEKVLEKVKGRKPEMILLDINLPGMDGLTALRKLKEIDKKLAVIMISGNTEVELAREAVKLGAADYIMKPLNMEYLELSVLTKIFLGESMG